MRSWFASGGQSHVAEGFSELGTTPVEPGSGSAFGTLHFRLLYHLREPTSTPTGSIGELLYGGVSLLISSTATAATLLCLAAAAAQDLNLNPTRPTVANAAAIQSPGVLEVETGYDAYP